MNDREPIIQAADGEVKPDPPIEIYPSTELDCWMIRWHQHEYPITDYPLSMAGNVVQAYIEYATGEKVRVAEDVD